MGDLVVFLASKLDICTKLMFHSYQQHAAVRKKNYRLKKFTYSLFISHNKMTRDLQPTVRAISEQTFINILNRD